MGIEENIELILHEIIEIKKELLTDKLKKIDKKKVIDFDTLFKESDCVSDTSGDEK